MPVDGMYPHTDTVHQPTGRGSDAAKPEDSADTASEHPVSRELINLAPFEAFVFQNQALGGSKHHGESMLSHRPGITAAVGRYWHALREFAQRNKVHASDHELDEPRAVEQLCLAGSQFFGRVECQEHAGFSQCFGARRFIELSEIYDGACTSESVAHNCLTLLA